MGVVQKVARRGRAEKFYPVLTNGECEKYHSIFLVFWPPSVINDQFLWGGAGLGPCPQVIMPSRSIIYWGRIIVSGLTLAAGQSLGTLRGS